MRNRPVNVFRDRNEHCRFTLRPFGFVSLVQWFGHLVHLVQALFAGFVLIVPFGSVCCFQGMKDALQQDFRAVIQHD